MPICWNVPTRLVLNAALKRGMARSVNLVVFSPASMLATSVASRRRASAVAPSIASGSTTIIDSALTL